MKDAKGMHEEHKRSALKTLSWRIVSTISTMFAFYVLTQRLDFTVGVGLIDIFLRTPLYFFHERAWDKLAFGRTIRGTMKSAIREPAVTANPSDAVFSVIEKMIALNIGAVVVTENNKPCGVITEKDILEKVVRTGKNSSTTLAKNIMSSPAVTVEYKEPLIKILKMMREKDIRRLVVTKNGNLAGIVTERRLLNTLL